MPLKITKAADPIRVDTLTTVIYSAPGLGKTTVAFTADSPLLLDFDGGVYRARNRRDSVRVNSWRDVTEIGADDLRGYKTLIVDTAGRALDMLTLDILATNDKAGRGGVLSIQGYGILKRAFTGWMSYVRSFGLDIVLIAHMEEQRKGEETVERLDVQGGSKGEIYKSADAMGRLYMSNGKRMLNFSPTDVGYGKNPGQLEPLVVPGYAESPRFLADVIARVKAALNEESETAAREAAELAKWQERIDGCKNAADFDRVWAEIKSEEPPQKTNVRRMFEKAAKAMGVTWDKDAGKFVGPKTEQEAA